MADTGRPEQKRTYQSDDDDVDDAFEVWDKIDKSISTINEGSSVAPPKRLALANPLTDQPMPDARYTTSEYTATATNSTTGNTSRLAFRALLTKKESGIVIGKGGSNVSEIRKESGARVHLDDSVIGAQERVITVMGAIDIVAKAYSLIARKLANESDVEAKKAAAFATLGAVAATISAAAAAATTTGVTTGATTSAAGGEGGGGGGDEKIVMIRLLIPNSHMGSIIGKSGAKIKEIQEKSNARVVAWEQMLPHSNDRMVTVTGVADAIQIAIFYLGKIVEANPERSAQSILYKPIPGFGVLVPSSGFPSEVVRSRSEPQGIPQFGLSAATSAAATSAAVPMASYHPSLLAFNPPPPPPPPAVQGLMQTQQIFIPNELVGAVIGKSGHKINEIRQNSGSSVKIEEPIPGVAERLVTIHGTQESNQMALYLLYQRLETEKARTRR